MPYKKYKTETATNRVFVMSLIKAIGLYKIFCLAVFVSYTKSKNKLKNSIGLGYLNISKSRLVEAPSGCSKFLFFDFVRRVGRIEL